MVDPVNLNVPGLDYLLFALLFFAVVGVFTLVLVRAELALRRKQRASATESNTLLVSRRVEGGLEWVSARSRDVAERARERRTRRQSGTRPAELIEEAEE